MKKKAEPLSLKETYSTVLLDCTNRHIENLLIDYQEELKDLNKSKATTGTAQRERVREEEESASSQIRFLEQSIGTLRKIKEARPQIMKPIGQIEKALPGNGIVIKFMKTGTSKKLFFDTTCVGRCTGVVSLQSPLGEKLLGMRVGEKGFFVVPNVGIREFELVELTPYAVAKTLLKMTKEERIQELVEA